jgi:acetylornithine deacetylase/succinyl-diaminopimelate desuccinylase-like protein
MSDSALGDEVVELAQALIRLDTSNPPGNETPAAELLAAYLNAAGVDCELIGPDPERLNLVARIPGAADGPSLMLMAHTDVVPAPPEDWTVPPFEGRLDGTRLIGRGAADMKGELAARAVAFAAVARSGEALAGDLVLVAEADEERGGADVGMSWVVRERPDLRCDFALNEGGGMLLELADGGRVVTIAVGEKRVASLRVRVHGRAGHASVPAAADNPVAYAAAAVDRLLAHQAPVEMTDSSARALGALGAPTDDASKAIAWAQAQHPVLADTLPAMVRLTVTPTGLQTHEPANVIPPYADVICDVRAMPAQTLDDIRAHIDTALDGSFEYEVELLEPLEGGTEAPLDTELYRTCEEYVATRVPGAALVPMVSPGFSDSYWVRQAHGTVAYGFAPVFATDTDAYHRGPHGADECIDVADLVEMTEFHLHAVRALGAQARSG